jgi:Sulfotransferase family
VKLEARDFALVKLNRRLERFLRLAGDVESDLFARHLRKLPIDRPVFVTGLARSGTTMLLTILAQAAGVATHRYRDFPFLSTPILWNRYQAMSNGADAPVERPHGDRIQITRDSPEAFEEPIWQAFFPWVHDPKRCHRLDGNVRASGFEDFFKTHLRKILWLRDGRRYLSKGNYNIARLEYLARLFPDARFVIPVRNPLAHVQSLVRQHQRFCRYATDDERVPVYLAAAGHYEFGPQRVPTNLDASRVGSIQEAWDRGGEYRGYARQWAEVYAYVDQRRRSDSALAQRMTIVRFEDLCNAPAATIESVMAATQLDDAEARVSAAVNSVAAPADTTREIAQADRAAVAEEVATVAARYGYGAAEHNVRPRVNGEQ